MIFVDIDRLVFGFSIVLYSEVQKKGGDIMKRILAILIAGIMSLSLFTVNASAYTNPNVVVVRDYNGKTKLSSLEIVGSTAY